MKIISPKFILGATLCCAMALASRADIVVDQAALNGSYQILYYSPTGQSFTAASDQLISFDFYFRTFNPGFGNNPLTIDILDGDGLGGPVLASSTFSLADGFDGLAGATFNLNVITGNVYTAVVSTSSIYWGLGANTFDVYSGGQLYAGNSLGWGDVTFRATFADASVPESGTTLLLVGGALSALALFRRRFQG